MTILVLAEHDNKTFKPNLLNVLGAATQLGDDIAVMVIGMECATVASDVAKIPNVKKVLLMEATHYAHQLAENVSLAVSEQLAGVNYLLAPASTFGKSILPRVAALSDVSQISDIIGIENKDTFLRPIYAGNAIATVQSSDTLKVITVRATAFDAVAATGGEATINTLEPATDLAISEFVKEELTQSERPELTAASVVVSGGRGLQNTENFKLIEQLADKLGAAVGASRAAVDAGYVPNDYQVGQTGKIVAPNLYIAIGISGAIQHLAGMKESKVIVAINKDPDAPIFQIADYGLVADLFEAVPALIEKL